MIDDDAIIDLPANIMADWQEIVNILAEIIGVPAALIMRIVEPDIEVFVSSQSAGNPYRPGCSEPVRDSGLYCETVIRTMDKLLVPNALDDALWKNNPDIKLDMIAYLGFPILLPNRKPFGTICILDTKANAHSPTTEKLMLKFRGLIESHLEMVYLNRMLGDKNKRLTDYLKELQVFRGMVPICSNCKSIRDNQGQWHTIETYLVNNPEAEFTHGICPTCTQKLYPDFVGGL